MPAQLTDNQLLYRAYLQSPLWKEKRRQAIEFYGPVCMRCRGLGYDVHHKTYARVGGNELMEDFEIMCRDCHDAHHGAARCVKLRAGKRRGIHRRAIRPALNRKHVSILRSEFPDSGNLYSALSYGKIQIAQRAAGLLGFDYVFGTPKQKSETAPELPRKTRLYRKLQFTDGQGFKVDESKFSRKKLASLKDF